MKRLCIFIFLILSGIVQAQKMNFTKSWELEDGYERRLEQFDDYTSVIKIFKNGRFVYQSSEMMFQIYGRYFSENTDFGRKLIDIETGREIYTALGIYSSGQSIIPVRGPGSNDDNGFYYIDLNGRTLFDGKKFNKAFGFYENHAVVFKTNWKATILDVDGNLCDKEFEDINHRFSEGLVAARTEKGKTGFIDYEGNFVIEMPIFYYELAFGVTDFINGYAFVKVSKEKDTWRIINKKGKYVSEELKYIFPTEKDLLHYLETSLKTDVKKKNGKKYERD